MDVPVIALTSLIILATYLAVIMALGKAHRDRMNAFDFIFYAVSGNIAANCICNSWSQFGENYIAFLLMAFAILLIDGIRRQRK